MKKLLLFFFLLVCSGATFADASSSSILSPTAITKYTDMSVYYLSQIFGTVGTVLVSNGSQMMGQMFYTLNWGIFLASSIMIGYAVVMSTIRLASEGVTMAQGKSTLFTLLKISLGIALVMPSASTGYSVLQAIVMETVVKGVGLADSVWAHGLEYLNKGGVVWVQPKSNKPVNPYTTILKSDNMTALLDKDKMASQIFQNEVCMLGSRDSLVNASNNNGSSTMIADGTVRPYYNVVVNENNKTFDFPGINDDATSGASCGKVSWDIKDACGSGDTTCSIARDAVSQLINTLMPAAQNYYCYMKGSSQGGTCANRETFSNSLNAGLAPYLVSALTNYYPAIKVWADMKENQASNTNKNFIDSATKEGWLMAGRYYWDVMQFTRKQSNDSDLSNYTNPTMIPRDLSNAGSLAAIVKSSSTDFQNAWKSTDFTKAYDTLVAQVGDDSRKAAKNGKYGNKLDNLMIDPAQGGALVGSTMGMNPGVGMTFITVMAGIDAIGNKFKDFDGKRANPISFLYEIGQACLNLTIAIWIIGGALISGSVAVYSICAASNPLGFGSTAMAEWTKPIFMMIATALWGAGFFLSYYVPLYPFIIFLFASLGWFISVIEAMVAAPLVALGMTHPDSHDLLGKSEQAIMLLLSVFIQPSLLVIGLIAGIIVSFVSFELLIYTFSGFVVDIMGSSQNSAPTTNITSAILNSPMHATSILIQPLLLVVFCVLTYTLLTQSFSLLYLLRDNVMKWIGAPTTGLPNPEQAASETKGAVSGMGSQTGQSVAQGTSAGSSSLSKDVGEQGRQDRRDKDSGKLKGNGNKPAPK